MTADTLTESSEILHRHADGTEHAHAGREGFSIGGQTISGHYGDEPTHSHSTLSLTGDNADRKSTGSVVWSERLGDVPTPIHHWTPERALEAARRSIHPRDWFTPEAVAAKMVEHDCGTWHGSHLVTLDAIAAGIAGYGTCTICGGPTAPNQDNAHAMCTVRARLGRDIVRLDSTPICSCAPCAKARGDEPVHV